MIRKNTLGGRDEEGGREGGREGVQKSLEHSKLLHEFVRALINHATTHLTAAAAHTQKEGKNVFAAALSEMGGGWVHLKQA
jgi:hypothetical protein